MEFTHKTALDALILSATVKTFYCVKETNKSSFESVLTCMQNCLILFMDGLFLILYYQSVQDDMVKKQTSVFCNVFYYSKFVFNGLTTHAVTDSGKMLLT